MRKLKADIKRFIYIKEKMNCYHRLYPKEHFDMNYIMPYPGVYLNKTINELMEEGKQCMTKLYPEICDINTAVSFVNNAYEVAKTKALEFFNYRDKWQRILPQMQNNVKLQNMLKDCLSL